MDTDLPEELLAYTRDLADQILFDAVDTIHTDGITDTTALAGSGNVEPNAEGGWDVVFKAEHAEWVEFGTTAHSISKEGEEAIKEWVKRKLRPTPDDGESQAAANRRVANAVIWKIRKQGTQPKPFLRPAFEKIADSL